MLVLAMLFGVAEAVPLYFTHQGRMVDSAGIPVEGAHTVTVNVYTDPAAGDAVWTDSFTPLFENGVFSFVLGSSAPITPADFDGPRWIGLSLDDGAELSPRIALSSVPSSFYAINLDGGTVDATEARVAGVIEAGGLAVGGYTVVAADGTIAFDRITGAPADADTLASLTCGPNEVATWNGSAWGCGAVGTGSVDVSALTGTIALANLPVGTGDDSIAAGDHTHGFGQITGQAAFAQLPVGAGADQVAAGNHTHDFAQITGTVAKAQLPTLTASDVGALPAGGGVKVGDAGTTCGTPQLGTLSYGAGVLRVCTDEGWVSLASARDGSSASVAATSCYTLHNEQPYLGDGEYWINPSGGATAAAFRVHCDMTRRGGGWTRVYYQDSRNNGYFAANQSTVNKADPNAKVYAVLGDLEHFRRDGGFEFVMRWPGNSAHPGDNQWRQTNNPVTDAAGALPTGYSGISIAYTTQGWGGLQRSLTTASSLLDGTISPVGNWYYAVGTTYCWGSVSGGCMPAPTGETHVAELWVR